MKEVIKLSHGCGGKPTARLVSDIFYNCFNNEILLQNFDSALLEVKGQRLAFTTDSFIMKPLFFPGGDIGKLSVCGTINDLAVSGAIPKYLSCSVIIEEGFEVESLRRIVNSMAETASRLGVKIVTGDTKVVEKGNAEGIYINTSGIGFVLNDFMPKQIKSGDAVIISGGIGEHGAIVALSRYNIAWRAQLASDCAPIFNIVEHLQQYFDCIKLMKDPTRGGIATIVNEISDASGLGLKIIEQRVPVKNEIKAICSMLGMDPMYLACEGRLLLVAAGEKAEEILAAMKQLQCCQEAEIIGYFDASCKKLVYVENEFSCKRMLPALEGDLLPRIC